MPLARQTHRIKPSCLYTSIPPNPELLTLAKLSFLRRGTTWMNPRTPKGYPIDTTHDTPTGTALTPSPLTPTLPLLSYPPRFSLVLTYNSPPLLYRLIPSLFSAYDSSLSLSRPSGYLYILLSISVPHLPSPSSPLLRLPGRPSARPRQTCWLGLFIRSSDRWGDLEMRSIERGP